MTKMGWLPGLLALLFVLPLVHLCTGFLGSKNVILFEGEINWASYGEEATRYKSDYRFPALVGGVIEKKEFLAVISSAMFLDFTSDGVVGVIRTSYGGHKGWSKAESFTNNDQYNKNNVYEGPFTSVMKGNKIYVLAKWVGIRDQESTRKLAHDWDPLLFVGTVNVSSGLFSSRASITWEAGKSLKAVLQEDLQKAKAKSFVGAAGNGIVTKSGAIVFPVRMKQRRRKNTSSILYSTDDGATWKFGQKTKVGTHDGSVVEWGDGKLLFNVLSDSGYSKVFESEDMGSTWKEPFVFSQAWGYDPEFEEGRAPGSAIKVPVDGKDVLLFAHSRNTPGGGGFEVLGLWMSDGQRIASLGTITNILKKSFSGSSMLAHVGDHLYITREINPFRFLRSSISFNENFGKIGFTPLPGFLNSAKTTLRAWSKLDTIFKTKDIPTEGLVGFLRHARENNLWDEKYTGQHAHINGGQSVDGGFRFDGGPGSGASWFVGFPKAYNVYAFAEKQFTLAATVTIHATNETGHFTLLGASWDIDGQYVLFSLGYTDDNEWYAEIYDNKKIETERVFEREKEYHIALSFSNGACSAYVNGVVIAKKDIRGLPEVPIEKFFMGGNRGYLATTKNGPCTMKNVMLFNRVLPEKDMAGILFVEKVEADIDEFGLYNSDYGTKVTLSISAWLRLACFVHVLIWL